jgi:hypothetical protein
MIASVSVAPMGTRTGLPVTSRQGGCRKDSVVTSDVSQREVDAAIEDELERLASARQAETAGTPASENASDPPVEPWNWRINHEYQEPKRRKHVVGKDAAYAEQNGAQNWAAVSLSGVPDGGAGHRGLQQQRSHPCAFSVLRSGNAESVALNTACSSKRYAPAMREPDLAANPGSGRS